ncbi:MAG: GNAT family N-acetyltransferase [Mycobacteriales bacterium]
MSVPEIVLLGPVAPARRAPLVEVADRAGVLAYRALRREVFVDEQGIFASSDADDVDDDPRTVVLVTRDADGTVLAGVRLGPVLPGRDLGWWAGSRLAVCKQARRAAGLGSALVRAACAHAEAAGALRFEATIQPQNEELFHRLGWQRVGATTVAGQPHTRVRWPVGRIAALADATKAPLGRLLAGLNLGGPGFVGDDGVPVPGTDVVLACDAITPSLVERDPEWAGWCGVLVNLNDLAAMGAAPVGLLDAVGARDASFAARVLNGVRRASDSYGVPVLGGHTTLAAPASLSVTAVGRARRPVPGAGGRPGHKIALTADLAGGWRPGHTGRQWDSTTHRSSDELRRMIGAVAAAQPAAAKDVSMAGVVGTLGMLAEASGCGAVLDVSAVPTPDGASAGDWLTCFPGFGMLTADVTPLLTAGPATSAVCGELVAGAGVRLRWPDGTATLALGAHVTGLGAA